MKISRLGALRHVRGRCIFTAAAVLALGLGMIAGAHAESYDRAINNMIERAKTDADFANRVRDAGPEAYPLVVLIAAGYDVRSAGYRRAMRLDSQGGSDN